jgi:hypothetical protein
LRNFSRKLFHLSDSRIHFTSDARLLVLILEEKLDLPFSTYDSRDRSEAEIFPLSSGSEACHYASSTSVHLGSSSVEQFKNNHLFATMNFCFCQGA